MDELAGVDLRRDIAAMTDELEAWQDQRGKDLDREYQTGAMARGTILDGIHADRWRPVGRGSFTSG
ncbi:MAG: hypothetical protein OEY41_08345, partial [Acidimicrobiia bacterium]|nr:hypothetical protein [Acidimicrobiia bacterium]